jgi:hypothetical protein
MAKAFSHTEYFDFAQQGFAVSSTKSQDKAKKSEFRTSTSPVLHSMCLIPRSIGYL